MNNLKAIFQLQKLEYFLTSADNYAVGYFQKQGFTKNAVLFKERWVGYIKDYDGVRAFDYERIRTFRRAHEIFPVLDVCENNARMSNQTEIPGILPAGWSAQRLFGGTSERDRSANSQKLSQLLKYSLKNLRNIQKFVNSSR